MRAVLQRVKQADVTINGGENRAIGEGLVILLGVMPGDTEKHGQVMAKKLCEMRIFSDENGKMNRSLLDIGGEMLLISNFTLGADCRRGTRPSFSGAAVPDVAEPLYRAFAQEVRRKGVTVQTGEFGADMQVRLVNDGPVTIFLDSDDLKIP